AIGVARVGGLAQARPREPRRTLERRIREPRRTLERIGEPRRAIERRLHAPRHAVQRRSLAPPQDRSPHLAESLTIEDRPARPRTLVMLNGSPVRGSSIDLLLEAVSRGAVAAGGEVIAFACRDLRILPW